MLSDDSNREWRMQTHKMRTNENIKRKINTSKKITNGMESFCMWSESETETEMRD